MRKGSLRHHFLMSSRSRKLTLMLPGLGLRMQRSGCWMSLGGMGRWRIGWHSGMSPRRIGPRQVMVLPSPFLGGDNITILVTRTHNFLCFSCTVLTLCACLAVFSFTAVPPCSYLGLLALHHTFQCYLAYQMLMIFPCRAMHTSFDLGRFLLHL
jgi:hypothetical protein